MIGGPMGAAMRHSAPSDQLMVNPIAPTAANTTQGGIIGAIIGGAVGGKIGKKSLIAGALIGGMAGGIVAPASYVKSRLSNNRQFYSQSPYNTSRRVAEQLNASGDIVFGMHNTRGGM
jgi:uncharacterized protein YcfJ